MYKLEIDIRAEKRIIKHQKSGNKAIVRPEQIHTS